MTGFDVPSCSTIYLDKPMRNHTLMQTIARANRVFPEKVNGLIVDYVGVFRSLEKALAIYGEGAGGGNGGGGTPVKDKSALVEELKKTIEETQDLCKKEDIDLTAGLAVEGFDQIKFLDDSVEILIGSDELKKRYLTLANVVVKLYKAILPDPAAMDLAPISKLIGVIAKKIRSLTPPVDISEIMAEVETVLDESIATKGYVIKETIEDYDNLIDISKIDFDALKEKFKIGRKHTEAEMLKGLLDKKLADLVRKNRTRLDLLSRFQKMIEEYNAGSLNVEEFFQRLLELAQQLNEEEKRGIVEGLSEEELALFDILTKPEMELTDKDRKLVKKTARELLETLKREKLVLDWRKRQASRAGVKVSIEKVLDEGLPEIYNKALYQQKSQAVFQHVYESYFGAESGIYVA